MKIPFFDQETVQKGVGILELGIILVIIGLLLFMGTGAWNLLIGGRRISSAKNVLRTSNECLKAYLLASKKIPDENFFKKECSRRDTWGQPLYFYSPVQRMGINCTAALKDTFYIRDSHGRVIPDCVWVIYSRGPNRKADVISAPKGMDFSKGDDLYVFFTDNEAHEEVCP